MASLDLKNNGTATGCDPDPDPDPLSASSGDNITITNNSGSSQTLSNITDGLFNPTPADDKITISDGNGGTWSGRLGNQSGTYEYNDGSPARATRTGRIDIG